MSKFIIVQNIDKIKANIQNIISLNNEEWLLMTDAIGVKYITKNEYLLKQEEVCDFIAYINKGILIHSRILDSGDEITTDFAFEGEWVTNNHSRLNGFPSHLNIKAIENSELLILQQNKLNELYNKIPKLEQFGRILMEQAYVKLVQLSIDLQVLSAKDRYIKLLETHSEIFHRIPLYHIANYLGIAPKSLSRIRNTIFTND